MALMRTIRAREGQAMQRRDVLAGLAALPLCQAGPAMAFAGRADDDLAVVRAAMAIHPGRDRYLSSSQFAHAQARFEQAYRVAFARNSLDECYLALSRFLTALRCGHSYANFFNQSNAVAKALFDRPTRLPCHFEWIDGAMVVTADHSGTGALPRGSRITAVNGQPAAALLAQMIAYTRADGHNDGKRRSLLGVSGAATIEYFDVFQGLLQPPANGRFVLMVEKPGGQVAQVTVPAIGLAARRATMTRLPADSDAPRWTYRVRPDGIAVLDMPDWAMWNSKWDWRTWLSDRLDDATKARGLILDIRRNEGGDDCGNPILARLIDRETSAWPFTSRVRFRSLPAALADQVSTWDDSYRHLGEGGADLGHGWFALPAGSAATPIQPDAKRLAMPVAVLTSPTNSSATFGFISAALASGKVTLFGQTTGGNRRGIYGGGFFFTKLPASGIEFDLPLIGYFPLRPEPDAGIVPDHVVPQTAAAIAQGEDLTMAAAVAWLAQA